MGVSLSHILHLIFQASLLLFLLNPLFLPGMGPTIVVHTTPFSSCYLVYGMKNLFTGTKYLRIIVFMFKNWPKDFSKFDQVGSPLVMSRTMFGTCFTMPIPCHSLMDINSRVSMNLFVYFLIPSFLLVG